MRLLCRIGTPYSIGVEDTAKYTMVQDTEDARSGRSGKFNLYVTAMC